MKLPELSEVAPGVVCFSLAGVNVYLVGEPGGPWALVDAGLPFAFEFIKRVAADRFGKDSRPEAIYLTHGHYDHVGSALALAAYWDVPVYAHHREMPYVTGRSEYPPIDPTTGGLLAFLMRFWKPGTMDLSGFVRELPEGELPGMAGWEVHHSPGHTPGHVAFFRRDGRVLLAGDSCATADFDKWSNALKGRQILVRTAAPITPDWLTTRKSMKRLAKLLPNVLACGHGVPMSGPNVAGLMESVAEEFIIPLKGRYVSDPVQFNEDGEVTYLPPKPKDPLPAKVASLAAVATVVGVGLYLWRKRRKG